MNYNRVKFDNEDETESAQNDLAVPQSKLQAGSLCGPKPKKGMFCNTPA
jgi:hypothetical protein